MPVLVCPLTRVLPLDVAGDPGRELPAANDKLPLQELVRLGGYLDATAAEGLSAAAATATADAEAAAEV